jgi:translation initiation factor IF-3
LLKQLRINNQIRVPQLDVVDDEGKQLGIIATFEALKIAKERDLDLVEVNPNSQPPIAKIMD